MSKKSLPVQEMRTLKKKKKCCIDLVHKLWTHTHTCTQYELYRIERSRHKMRTHHLWLYLKYRQGNMFRDHEGHISSARVSLCNSVLFSLFVVLPQFFVTFVHIHPPAVTTQLQDLFPNFYLGLDPENV